MSDFEISERKLRASPEFFIFFYNSFFAVASIIKGIKKSGCEDELKKKFHTADLYNILCHLFMGCHENLMFKAYCNRFKCDTGALQICIP